MDDYCGRLRSLTLVTVAAIGCTLLACKAAKREANDAFLKVDGGSSCVPYNSSKVWKPGDVPTRDMIRSIAGVNDNEVKAVQTYTESVHNTGIIKSILKGDLPGEDLEIFRNYMGRNYEKIAEDFKSGVSKISQKFPFKGTVYRGILVAEEDAEQIKQIASHKGTYRLGQEGHPSYTSTSRSRTFAEQWLDQLEAEGGGRELAWKDTKKIFYDIKQCRGASIENIDVAPRGQRQKEVILPPSDFKISNLKEAGSTLFLSLIEVGCDGLGLVGELKETMQDQAHIKANQMTYRIEDPILEFFDFASVEEGSGLALSGNEVCADPKLKEKFKKEFEKLDLAIGEVKKAEFAFKLATKAAESSKNSSVQIAARDTLRKAQAVAKEQSKSFSDAMKAIKPVRTAAKALKLAPVINYAAQGAAFALSIAEAVEIKKQGRSDSAAAAAVLDGAGMAGAIPALLACEDCTPDEKAAAFFSGFFGIDFTNLVVCPGKRCPGDRDLAGYPGDWSLNRVKRSCPKGMPVVGSQHAGTAVDLICGSAKPIAVRKYEFVDNGRMESSKSSSLRCADGQYMAGVSFLTGRGAPTYGIKSILCAYPSAGFNGACRTIDGDSCPKNQYIRGINLERAYRDKGYLGIVCSKAVGEGRDDDQFEYCDHIMKVECCDFPSGI